MNVNHYVTIDVLRPRANVIHVVQDDSTRILEISLLKGDRPFDISTGETEAITGAVAYERADKTGGVYDTLPNGKDAVTVSGSVVTARIVGAAFSKPGPVRLNVVFSTESGRMLHTFSVIADVERSAQGLDTPTEDYYNVRSLADARAAIEDLDNRVDDSNADITALDIRVTALEQGGGGGGDTWVDITSGYRESGKTPTLFGLSINNAGQWYYNDGVDDYYVSVVYSPETHSIKITKISIVSDDVVSNAAIYVNGTEALSVIVDYPSGKTRIYGLDTPSSANEAVNKEYVDATKPMFCQINTTNRTCDKTNAQIYARHSDGGIVRAIIDGIYIAELRMCQQNYAAFETNYFAAGMEQITQWIEVNNNTVTVTTI